MKKLIFFFGLFLAFNKSYSQCNLSVSLNYSKSEITVCQGKNTLLEATASQDATFEWYLNGNKIANNISNQYLANQAGNFSVKAISKTNPNCTATKAISIKTITAPTIELTSDKNPKICPGEQVKLTTGAELSEWDLQWYIGDVPLQNGTNPQYTTSTPGSYRLVAQYEQCTAFSDSKTITVLPAPTADFDYSIAGLQGVNFINKSEDAVSYVWNFGDGQSSTSSNPSNKYSKVGSYQVELIATAKSGCTDKIIKTIHLGTTSTLDAIETKSFEVYPNPTSGVLFIEGENSENTTTQIQLMDITGKILEKRIVKGTSMLEQINLTDQQNGTYLIQVIQPTSTTTYKVVKN